MEQKGTTNDPYLSVIASARNADDEALKLLRLFCKSLGQQAQKFEMPLELILVEWNPPLDRSPLSQALESWLEGLPIDLKIITVPFEVHDKFLLSRVVNSYDHIALNVAIQRARGEFFLCTNPNCFLSNDLFASLARKQMEAGILYRANTAEIIASFKDNWDLIRLQRYSRYNVVRRWGKNGNYPLNIFNLPDFAYAIPLIPTFFNFLSRVVRLFKNQLHVQFFDIDWHFGGDFILMDKQSWLNTGGFAELDLYSTHMDKLLLVSAIANGMIQKVFLPGECVYRVRSNGNENEESLLEGIRTN